jgi:hypothetical protein
MPNRSTDPKHYDGPIWWWPIAAIAVLALLGLLVNWFLL